VIHRQHDDSSMDQVAIATRKYLSVSCHLLDNLGDPSQLPQHQKWLTLRLVQITRDLMHNF
jgi:hypothetical protein